MWYVMVKSLIDPFRWNTIDEGYSKQDAEVYAMTALQGGVDVVAIEGPDGEWFEYVNHYGTLTETARS